MSDQTQSSNQQMIVIALAVVALLLAGVVGFVVFQQSKTASNVPEPSGALAGSSTSKMMGGGETEAPAGMGGGAAATGEFDEKTATKVPAGMTPEQLVKAYNEAAIKGDFEKAYKMLPVAKQQSYGDVKAYGEQVKGYGITSFEMGKPITMGDTLSIAATQVTPQMPITYTWKFRKVGDQWYVESREMGGTP